MSILLWHLLCGKSEPRQPRVGMMGTNREYRFRIEFTKIYGIPSILCALRLPRSLVTAGQLHSHTVYFRYLFGMPSSFSTGHRSTVISYYGRFHIVAVITTNIHREYAPA